MHSRHTSPLIVRRIVPRRFNRFAFGARHLAAASCVSMLCASATSFASAQRADSAHVAATQPPPTDTSRKPLPKPPLSPRRAFLYSLALPGYAQSVLSRPTAGALFLTTEAIAIAMLRESSADLREARRFRTDSLIVIGTDATGQPITQVSPFSDRLVNTRRGHVEDWIAFLIANHLFAAADAYVAAHLWDLPSQISVESRSTGTVVAARFRW